MDEVGKIISTIKKFIASVLKAAAALGLKIERQRESKKETLTVEIGENGSCLKHEIHHEKSNTKFSIGFLINENDTSPKLFISVNSVRMLLDCKYLLATPICCDETPSNEECEVWYTAAESVNKDYFSETSSETRKDEIIEQILTEVVKSLNDQC